MSRTYRIVVLLVLGCAIGGTFIIKANKGDGEGSAGRPAAETSHESAAPADAGVEVLPRLVDLGAGKCIPCKAMAPIIEELKEEYKGTFDVQFIDVWEDQSAGEKYGIRIIPTQVFYDSVGNEIFRHEGFFSKEDILSTWKKHGIDVSQELEQE